MIITFEGIDGSGKSTAVEELEAFVDGETKYESCVLASRCLADMSDLIDYDEMSEWAVRRKLSPRTLALLRCMELNHSWDSYGRDAHNDKDIVICDRYIYTPLVRDCIRGVEAKYMKNLYSHFPKPDLVFYLDTKPKEALKRKIEGGIPLGDYESGLDLYRGMSIQKAFLKFQKKCTERYSVILPKSTFVINGNRSAYTVFEDIVRIVTKYIKQQEKGKN